MAAGLGFKTFTTGEVLTAADVNGYLMQGILVFATEAARNSAITSPQEGQFAFTKDNNSLWYYTGSAWVASGATGDIEGVTAGVGISGGGTSGTVTITNSMATAIDAKGDLVPGTGADTFSRLAVGANGTVLTADSAEATGLKWATPASGGGETLLETLALSGSGSVTSSTIAGTYKHLFISLVGLSASGAGIDLFLRLNADSNNNYVNAVIQNVNGSISGSLPVATSRFVINELPQNTQTGDLQKLCGEIFIPRYADTGQTYYSANSIYVGNSRVSFYNNGFYDNSGAITSITLLTSAGTFNTGTAYLYGVS